jgi:uncharacterized protein YggE
MQRMLAAIRAQGVADRDLRTQRVDVDRVVRRGRVVAYRATNAVFVTVRAIAKTGSVIDAAVAAGANRIDGPTFWRLRTADLYRQALVTALRKARAKAEALAAESGATLGEVLSISESGAQLDDYLSRDASSGVATTGTPIRPGRARVTADLTAVFAIT